jgi:hypothetical protein
MTSNTHSVQRNIAGVLAVLTRSASALRQKLGQAVSVWPVFPMAQPKERASRRFGIVLAWTAHRIGEITKHSRDFGMHHIAIFPFVRWIRSIFTNWKSLPLLPTEGFFLHRGLHQGRTSHPNHLFGESACALSPLRNVKSTIADTDAKQPLLTLLTANPLEAVNRAVEAALDQPSCGGFMRFTCRKEEAKA